MLGIQLVLLAAMLIFTVIVRWRLRNEESAKKMADSRHVMFTSSEEENVMSRNRHVMFTPSEEENVDVYEDHKSAPRYFEEFSEPLVAAAGVVPMLPVRYECAVCCSPTSTRCSRCKSARYCSSKCQIIHWRQGHKYECHPLASSDSDRGYSNGKEEISEQFETNGSYSVEVPRKINESTVGQNQYDGSDPHDMMPRLSTVTSDPSDFARNPIPTGEQEKPAFANTASHMARAKDKNDVLHVNNSSKLMSTDEVNSVKKLNREKSRHTERRKSRASTSEMPSGLKRTKSAEGVVSDDFLRNKFKEVPDAELQRNEVHEYSLRTKHVGVNSFPSAQPVNSSVPSKSSSSTHSPHGGFKASLQKVVHNLKASHQKKPPLQNSFLASENHSRQAIFQYGTFLKWYSSVVELKPFGLINCGNSCYANAVLQCLAYTRPLTLYLQQGVHSRECWKEDWCFICEFEHLIQKAKEGYTPLSPIRILSNISHLGHGKEEDAHEFLRYAVDTMQSVCVQLAGVAGPVTEETTLISMAFGGYLHSKIKCMKCHTKSDKFERMMDLTVEIDGDIRTLEQALKRFTGYEILDGENKYLCGRCKSYERAKKKLSVYEAPNILTIVLKRFQAGTLTKLNKVVQFPEILNMAPFMSHSSDRFPQYSLYAVIVHLDVKSASFGGHYVCYVKNYYEEWFKIDDSVVMSAKLESVLSEEAYILLYARQSPRSSTSAKTASDSKLADYHFRAVPTHVSGNAAMPKARHKSSDLAAMQHLPSRNSYGKDTSYLEEWVTHSVESIPRVDSSSEVSSLFSHSEEGTCSTPSTKESASVEDFSDYLFGRGGLTGR